jgi:hypothetical protein
MDFGKCFRFVTHEGKVPGSITRVAFRTPFIDAICVSFQTEKGGKRRKKKRMEEGKRRQQTRTHRDEMCRRVFPRDTSLTFCVCFGFHGLRRFVFFLSTAFLVDDSQKILFNTIKYYERKKG